MFVKILLEMYGLALLHTLAPLRYFEACRLKDVAAHSHECQLRPSSYSNIIARRSDAEMVGSLGRYSVSMSNRLSSLSKLSIAVLFSNGNLLCV